MEKLTQVMRELLTNKVVYINYWSTDCDGCSSEGHNIFKTLKHFEEWEQGFYDNCEGRQGWEVTTKEHLDDFYTGGSW